VIAVELVKLLRRPRVWVAVALLCALPVVVAVFLATTHVPPPPGQGGAFLSAVLRDGSLYPAAAMAMVVPVFLPVAVAVVAGDGIAGEAATGTLRYLLVRPVGRTRLLVAKFVAVSMLGVAAIALFLSTLTDSALGAALGALAALVTSQILATLDAAATVKPYLPTRYWLAWVDFFRDPVFWRDIERGAGIQAVYVAVLLAAAWANFATRDITS